MTSRDFIIDAKRFDRRTLTEIQHRLRTLLKCYTITGFKMLDGGQFKFKKSYMIRKKRFDDPKEYEGFYTINNISEGKYKLSLSVTGVIEEQFNNG
jgi:hypothetical protein